MRVVAQAEAYATEKRLRRWYERPRELFFAEATAVRRPDVVADPAEGFEAAPEAARDGWREPGVRVIEAPREQIAVPGFMQREQSRVAFARRAGVGIGEQVHLAGDTRDRCADRATGRVLDDELRDENWIREIGERVVEALAPVDAVERVEIGGGIGANVHVLEHAGTQERVRACDGFGGVEGGGARSDAVRYKRFVRGVRDSFRREGMRQRFERGVVIEREVNALVGVDEDEDARCGVDAG